MFKNNKFLHDAVSLALFKAVLGKLKLSGRSQIFDFSTRFLNKIC